jgi:hypothetical protein
MAYSSGTKSAAISAAEVSEFLSLRASLVKDPRLDDLAYRLLTVPKNGDTGHACHIAGNEEGKSHPPENLAARNP